MKKKFVKRLNGALLLVILGTVIGVVVAFFGVLLGSAGSSLL